MLSQYALFINGGRVVETRAEFTKWGLGGIAKNMVLKKEGMLDQNENRLDSLSFQTKRKWRNDGYMPYVEMLVDFLASSGHQKVCALDIWTLVRYRRVLVDKCLWRQVQFR